MESQKKYWIGFNRVKGIGPVRFQSLLDFFGDAQAAWEAPTADLAAAGLGSRLTCRLIRVRTDLDLDRVWEAILSKGIGVVTWQDEGYPISLREIGQSPPVLFIKGELTPEDEWTVAVVGTRRASSYGRQVAAELATEPARNGVTVASGLARGVDSIAHRSALNAGGRSLAVLGSGVDRIYPPENRRLAKKIAASGAVISDYPAGTPLEASNFPPRNRIISGLSKVVVILEASHKSGALITASFAADQGRDVFAVPGLITAPGSRGTNRLIQDGARPMLSPQDVLEVLDLSRAIAHRSARKVLPTAPVEAQLLAALSDEPVHIDEIGVQVAMPIEKISATLALMELKGMVRQVGGMRYVSVRETFSDYQVE
jgi:DNA processing protein